MGPQYMANSVSVSFLQRSIRFVELILSEVCAQLQTFALSNGLG